MFRIIIYLQGGKVIGENNVPREKAEELARWFRYGDGGPVKELKSEGVITLIRYDGVTAIDIIEVGGKE